MLAVKFPKLKPVGLSAGLWDEHCLLCSNILITKDPDVSPYTDMAFRETYVRPRVEKVLIQLKLSWIRKSCTLLWLGGEGT